jgi:1-acyl-sn-glycerol-3-phosphate acyltransferase
MSLVVIFSFPGTWRVALRRFRRAIKVYGNVVIRILPFPWIRIRFKDHAPQEKVGSYIFVANHPAATDAFLMAVLPGEIVQVVNKWPFKLPILGQFARWAGYLSVNEMPYEEFFVRAVRYLQEGVSIVVFPEGTRSSSKVMGQFHGAMFRVALETKAAIVPVCIWGNKDIPVRDSLILRPGTIKVDKLKAVVFDEYKNMGPFKLKNHIRSLIAAGLEGM